MNRNTVPIFNTLGILSFVMAFLLTAYNLHIDQRGMRLSEASASAIASQSRDRQERAMTATTERQLPEESAETVECAMPISIVDGQAYIGILEIPSKELVLPVMNEWNYTNLKSAPCRFDGSLYEKNLIIVAHNYRSHFGQLKDLKIGDNVIFTDANGRTFCFEVIAFETIEPSGVSTMKSGDWELTLFTCTLGGSKRLAVRCMSVQEPSKVGNKST